MLSSIKFFVSLAIVSVLYSCNSTTTSTVPSNALLDEIKKINAKCPMIMDADFRVDSVKAFNEYMFTYHVTALKYSSKQLDLKAAKDNLEKIYCGKYATDPAAKLFRENKIQVAYDFKDKDGQFLAYFICGK